MTGSPLVPIVVPLVMLACLGAWIAIVFYADAHPTWKRGRAPAGSTETPTVIEPASEAAGQPAPPARRAA